MGFDVPMNAKGAMSFDQMLASQNGQGSAPTSAQPIPQQNYQQPAPVQQNYQQPVTQQNYQQPAPAPVQQNYQQPAPAPVQQNYQQPAPPQNKQRPVAGSNVLCLKKGQKMALDQGGNTLTRIRMGLGWDVVNQACDLDASAFMLDANDKVIGDDWFVFYGQLNSPDGSISHSGDSDGSGQGDDETITIDLNRVDNRVQKITFIVTINEALENNLNFSMVANAYVRIVNDANGQEIARFNLTDYYSNVTSMVVGELYRYKGQWKFTPVGDGVAQDLVGLCSRYGINASY